MSSQSVPRPVVTAAPPKQAPVGHQRPLLGRQHKVPPSTRIAAEEPYKPERLFDTSRAAFILEKSEESLKKWRQRRQGPAYIRYPDGTIRYRLSDLLKFMDECTVDELKLL